MIPLAMAIHVALVAMTVYEGAEDARNDWTRELRTALAVITTAAVWLVLWMSVSQPV